jgi:hypothetical protein
MGIDVVLERDLQWREAELTSLKILAITAPSGSVTQQSLLRAMWALLYAHFEGFTKFCWDTIFDHIQSAKLLNSELDEKFVLIALESDFKELRGGLDAVALWEFFSMRLPTAMSKRASFPDDLRLKTESNLWPNVFERESKKIGIMCSELDRHRTRIKTLVARRNDIAHGKSMTIATVQEYNEYENATICLMHELALKTLEIVEGKLYQVQPSSIP